METIKLRDFANLSCLDMINFCEVRREIAVIDDFEEETITDTLLLGMNWFGLITHRYFNDEPYYSDEVIDLSGKNGYPTFIDDKLLNKPLNVFLSRIMLTFNDPVMYDLIKQFNFVHQNLLHNYLSIIGESGAVTARAVDVNTIYNHPKIQRLKRERKERKISPEEANVVFDKIMTSEEDFNKSVFALLYRTKALDRIQSYQLLIERGRTFDLNNTIMPFNVDDSYCDGIINLADSLSDSKGAGFSLISNGMALKDAEWFHMKIHNTVNIITSIGYGKDCGSTKGAIIKVVSEVFRSSLQGKYYFKEDGSLELIHKGTIKNIKVGSTIKIRSIAWCNHGATGKPCATCFGKMDSVLPYNIYTKRPAVPGFFFGSVFGEKTGQTILKTKHRIGGATSIPFIIEKRDQKYINTDGDFIYFTKEFIVKEKRPYIIIEKEIGADFSDYVAMESIDELDSNHLPVRDTIKVRCRVPNPMFEGKFGVEMPTINTSVGSRSARMTKDFIRFLKDKQMEEEGKLYRISLEGWNTELPAYELPFINEDMDAYRKRVENFMKFTHLKGRIDDLVDEEFHGEQLVDFWKVIHDQNKDANIIIHDILLFSCMIKNPKALDFSLPNAEDPRYFLNFHDCIMNRGQGNALMYGWQGKSLTGSPINFLIKNRQRGVMESFLSPITKFN